MFNLEQHVIGRSKRRRLSYVQRTVPPYAHHNSRKSNYFGTIADKIYERFHAGLIKGFITDRIVEESTKDVKNSIVYNSIIIVFKDKSLFFSLSVFKYFQFKN